MLSPDGLRQRDRWRDKSLSKKQGVSPCSYLPVTKIFAYLPANTLVL